MLRIEPPADVPHVVPGGVAELAVEGTPGHASHRRGAAEDERVAALLLLVEHGRPLLGERQQVDVVHGQLASTPTLVLEGVNHQLLSTVAYSLC